MHNAHPPCLSDCCSGDRPIRRARELSGLREHWDAVYWVFLEGAAYCARRRDDSSIIRCATAEELREELRDDYAARPAARHGGILP